MSGRRDLAIWRFAWRTVLRRSLPVAAEDVWLSDCEREVWEALGDAGRREEWLLGRVLAKQLLVAEILAPRGLSLCPAGIQVHSRDGLGRAVRPRVTLGGRLEGWSVSIAHSEQAVMVALSDVPGVSVGVDVVAARVRSEGFVHAWLTPWEGQCVRSGPVRETASRTAAVWAVKEAFYKAANRGEPFVPGRIEACPAQPGGWCVRLDGAEPAGALTVRVAEVAGEVAALVVLAEDQGAQQALESEGKR